jgi:hypothetical protein
MSWFGGGMRDSGLNDAVGLGQIRAGVINSGRSNLDLQAWTCALRELPVAPVTEGDILVWVDGPLRSFFPFERFLGGYGSLSGGRIQMRSLVTIGHAQEFLASLEGTFDLKSRGCFAWWVANRKAFILDKAGARDEAGGQFLQPNVNSKRSNGSRWALSPRTESSIPMSTVVHTSALQAYRTINRSRPWRGSI